MDALEHMVQRAARQRWGYRGPIHLDVQGYKERRRRRWKHKIHEAIEALGRETNGTVVGPFPRTDQPDVVHALSGYDKMDWHIVGQGFYRVVVVHAKRSA